MLIVDEDVELLENFADGALASGEMVVMRARLASESELTAALDRIVTDRALRSRMFASLEPTETESTRFLDRVRAKVPKNPRRAGALRLATGIAACVAISFFAGWKFGGKQVAIVPREAAIRVAAGPKIETIVNYQVALTDEAGRVTAVQNFDSLEKAREFSQDLGQWQERRRQMQDGAAVVVADRF